MKTFAFVLLVCISLSGFSQTYTLEGKLNYKNNYHSRFKDSCYVTLKHNDTIVEVDTIGADGYYHFYDLDPGQYVVQATSNKTWVGGGSTDALIIMRHFVGMLPQLTGLNMLAGDPSNDGVLNSIDALMISRRFVQAITSFPGPDWIFETFTIDIVNTNFTQNIRGLCKGDTNGSGIPLNTVPE